MENQEEQNIAQEQENVSQEQTADPIVEAKIVEPTIEEDPNVVKVDLRKINEDAVQEQSTDAGDDTIEQPENAESSEEVVEEVREPEQSDEPPANDGLEETVLEEITEEEIVEEAQELAENVEEAIQEQQDSGIELPENIQKVVDFMNETGGTLEDYVALNRDYANVDDMALLRDYYQKNKPHLTADEIDFLIEDNFSYDETLDEERDIKRKKLNFKEEVAQARQSLEGLKNEYYKEIKAGSRLNPEQQKAVEFFNRYNKENEEITKVSEQQKSIFQKKTNEVFSDSFKGFEYNVGDKKYRFNVKQPNEVKNTQSDINNFVQKFLDENNSMKDAKGYHKALFTAMNTDKIAQHFYEQGRADALKQSISNAKNVKMNPRGVHEKVTSSSGLTVKAISGDNSSKLRVKIRK
jgi:hypothetical protein